MAAKTRLITFRVADETYDAYRRFADLLDVSLSDVMREQVEGGAWVYKAALPGLEKIAAVRGRVTLQDAFYAMNEARNNAAV